MNFIPFISFITSTVHYYFKDSSAVKAHGFDAVHIIEDKICLGETKFYGKGKLGIQALINDLNNGGQSRVRPFETMNIFEDKLYIQTGKGKAANDQIMKGGKVELCAMKGDEWIRLSGTLVLDERVEAGEAMLDAYPNLRSMYTTGENGNSVVYYLKDATAVISAFGHAPEIIKF